MVHEGGRNPFSIIQRQDMELSISHTWAGVYNEASDV